MLLHTHPGWVGFQAAADWPLIDSALVFLPADMLGPVAEQLLMTAGKTF